MDSVQGVLTKVLSKAIRGKDFKVECSKEHCEKVLVEAKAHHVHTLIYPLLKDQLGDDTKWRACVHTTTLSQMAQKSQLREVFESLISHHIPFIGLKGLYLQFLYPSIQVRMMSDIDLLVHLEDLTSIDQVLSAVGYKKKTSASTTTVTVYEHKEKITLEIHHHLFEADQLQDIEGIEKDLWQNQLQKDIFGIKVMFPEAFYHCTYMILHMAKHFVYSGFGLRQLADFVLIVEKSQLDPLKLLEETRGYGVDRFTRMLLLAGNRLLDLELCQDLQTTTAEDERYLNYFIQELLKDGVYGKKTSEQIAEHISINHQGRHKKLFLPTKDQLKSRYRYAAKVPFLLPVAWLHRIVYNAFLRRDIGIKQKWHIIKAKGESSSIRLEVLQWLALMR